MSGRAAVDVFLVRHMRVAFSFLLLSCACGRSSLEREMGVDGSAGAVDAKIDRDSLVGMPCDPSRPFQTPIRWDLAPRDQDRRPTLTADENIVYLARGDGGLNPDLFTATRTNGVF